MKFLKKAKGFTIIEVLIVLAIAGLIMSIVFVAVPQLQRNARDAKRQSIANRLSSELNAFAGNSQGTYPFVNVNGGFVACVYNGSAPNQSCSDWYSRYICTSAACTGANKKVDTIDPKTGNLTSIQIANTGTINWAPDSVWITVGATCNGDKPNAGSTGATATSKQYALTIALERDNTFYCADNG